MSSKKKKKSPPVSIAAIAELVASAIPSVHPPSEPAREVGSSPSIPASSAANQKLPPATPESATPATNPPAASPKSFPAGPSPLSADSSKSPSDPEILHGPVSGLASVKSGLASVSSGLALDPLTEAPPKKSRSFSVAAPLKPHEAPPQKSWASVVGKPTLTRFSFDVTETDGRAMVEVPDAVLEDSVPLWEDFLVGRFPSQAPHIAKIHVIVNKIWNLGDKSIKIDAYTINETSIKFRISNASARLRVLRRGMWNICDLPMIVSKWSPILEEAQPEIKSMPMWVKLKHIPHSLFSWKGLCFLASPVGYPIRLHQETELVTKFDEAKIFVDVDFTKEIPKSFYFRTKEEEFQVQYEYPWLPKRCGICRKWGHSETTCLCLAKTPTAAKEGLAKESDPALTATKETEVELSTLPETRNMEQQPLQAPELGKESSAVTETSQVQVEPHNPGQVLSEMEEEEIPRPQVSENRESATEEGWSTVSGSRHPTKTLGGLVYGQVRIAPPHRLISPTRFDILQTEPAEEDTEEQDGLLTDKHKELCKKTIQAEESNVEKHLPIRSSLPRNSKSAHKFITTTNQKTRDHPPSGQGKRSSKKCSIGIRGAPQPAGSVTNRRRLEAIRSSLEDSHLQSGN